MRARCAQRLDNFGGHSGGETPLPIPNREVKPASADGTRRATSRESRSPPNYLRRAGRWPASLVFGATAARTFVTRRAASRASPGRARAAVARARRQAGASTNSAARPFLGERVDRVERLRRRARLERDELASSARAGSARRPARAATRRARQRSGRPRNSRFGETEVHERRRERAEHEQQRALEEAADRELVSTIAPRR